MTVVVFAEIQQVIGPFPDLKAAQNYLAKNGCMPISERQWSSINHLKVYITEMLAP